MTTEIASLKDLYIDHLKDLYNAESQITKALPKIIKKVSSPDLKKGLEDHLKQTMNHINPESLQEQGMGFKKGRM